MKTITVSELEQRLTKEIDLQETELQAICAVNINTTHTKLTNRAIDGARLGDYIGIGKALYICSGVDVLAYTYKNSDGSEIGTIGMQRISRTMTPQELHDAIDRDIKNREESLKTLKKDLNNVRSIVRENNALAEKFLNLVGSVSWVTRGLMR